MPLRRSAPTHSPTELQPIATASQDGRIVMSQYNGTHWHHAQLGKSYLSVPHRSSVDETLPCQIFSLCACAADLHMGHDKSISPR